MRTWLRIQQDLNPKKAALHASRVWTYGELAAEAERRASALVANGIRKGDHVAYLLANTEESVFLIHALMHAGAVGVPLNTRLTSSERDLQLHFIQPRLVVIDDSRFRDAKLDAPTLTLSALSSQEPSPAIPAVEIDDDDVHSILFTSGTSGQPKAVPLTYANFASSAHASSRHLGVEDDDNWLCVLPLFHVGGLSIVLRSVIQGTALTLHESFDAGGVTRSLREDAVTLLSLVPTQLREILHADLSLRKNTVPRLRAILLGGGPISMDVLHDARKRGLPVLPTYGMTESASQISTMPLCEHEKNTGSAGKPLEGMQVRIIDENGHDVPVGNSGEIAIRGPMVFKSYAHNEQETIRRFTDGWFRTKDRGRLDEEGYLFVETRIDDMIITGGENVSPEEIEAVLLAHPTVREACVVGLLDERWGQRIAAVIVPQDTLDIQLLEQHCRSMLAGYKIPRQWILATALPRTPAGKTMRGALRDALNGDTS